MSKCRIRKVTTDRACKLSVKMGRTLSFIVKTAKVRAARSCEYSATNAWNLNLNNGNANNNTKATNQNRVRAVSAPLQIASTYRR